MMEKMNNNGGDRRRGRTVGSKADETKVKTSFTIDRDLMAALLQMPNRSAFVNRAIKAALHPSAQGADGRE